MFKNFKVIAHMKTPVATIDNIILDSIISAAKAKEILQDEFHNGKNICGTAEQIQSMLDPILNKKYGVYCTSCGIGDNKEFVTSWAKRWDDKHDDMVTGLKGKARVDVGAGHFKNYHMPLVVKSYKTITFYVNGDMEEIKRLLETYIYFLGKKSTQGFGQIKKWEFEEIEEDYSIFKDKEIMRPIPIKEIGNRELKFVEFKTSVLRECALTPPYWREDCRELCVIPDVNV